ncbi:hypothetical protein ACH4ZU_07820 [Streptomyces sp. NPDC020472]|uniref:hypothetical protein n=1 Tax=Streptomyces sp. NPDC020472 TaxID=3365075 RepID=UPI0037B1CE5F
MGHPAGVADGRPLMADIVSASGLFEGGEDIAVARELARGFLADVQAVHGLRRCAERLRSLPSDSAGGGPRRVR